MKKKIQGTSKKNKKQTDSKLNKGFLISLIVVTVLILDQLTKFLAEHVFNIQTVHNTGAAFGILKNMNPVFVWLYIIILGVLFFSYDYFPKNRFYYVMIALLIAGILGNLTDRIVYGYVIDFIRMPFWSSFPRFNIADSSIVVSVIGLIGYYIRNDK